MLLVWLAVVPMVSQSHMSISAAVQFLRTHPKGHGTAESNSEKTILTNDLPRSMPTSHEQTELGAIRISFLVHASMATWSVARIDACTGMRKM